ncbi:MAG: DUF190 domain-containing protein [Paludibacteraceae bacterium]
MESEYSVLKFFVSNTDKIGLDLLFENIVLEAHKQGIAGVTAYRGIMGYGLSSNKIVNTKFWEISEKLPVVIEMTDLTSKLNDFYKFIENKIEKSGKGCLIYIQPIDIKLHQSGKK